MPGSLTKEEFDRFPATGRTTEDGRPERTDEWWGPGVWDDKVGIISMIAYSCRRDFERRWGAY